MCVLGQEPIANSLKISHLFVYFHRILTRSSVIEVLQHPQHTYEHWATEHLEVQHMNLKQFYVAKFAIKEAELQKFTQNVFVHFDIWVN